jgi:formylglycine-generating enzyme required for sulfatase activity
VKRVKALARQFNRETFIKPALLTEKRKSLRKLQTQMTEPTEDPTVDEEVAVQPKNKFYVDPFTTNLGPEQYNEPRHRVTLESLAMAMKSPSQNPTFAQVAKGQTE